MKKLTILLIMVLGLSVHASAVDFSDDRGITVSAFFGYSHYRIKTTGVIMIVNENFPLITPRIGYRFNESWEAGAFYRYEKVTDPSHNSCMGIYGEWSFLEFLREFRMIAECHASLSFNKKKRSYSYMPRWKNMTEIGFTPCVAYHIPKTPVDIKLRYLFIGFNDSDSYYKKFAPGCLGRGDWIIDASLRRLEIGASITF